MISLTKMTMNSLMIASVLVLSGCGESNEDKAKRLAREGCATSINQNTKLTQAQRDEQIKACQDAIK